MGGFKVKSNLRLTFRERGKIVARREGHNIWLDFGRAFMSRILGYESFIPLVPEEDNRVSYMGFGIGGTRQISPSIANNEPLLSHYPGSNAQTDIMPGVTQLERPIRFGWAVGPNPPTIADPLIYDSGDIWLKQVQVPTHATITSTRFTLVATSSDLNGGYYLALPLSEIGLFHRGMDIHAYNNSPVAYDTFDSVQKAGSYDLTVSWTIRF